MGTQGLPRSIAKIVVQAAWERHGSRFNGCLAALLVGLTLSEALGARAVHLHGLGQVLGCWPGVLLIFGVLLYCHWRPLPRLIDSCELAIWAIVLTNVLSILIQIAGRSEFPIIDGQMERIDERMHFATSAVVHAAASTPQLRGLLGVAYALVPVMIMGAILLPPFFGKAVASRRYLVGVIVGAVMTAGLFAFWPAAGPWTTEGFQPTAEQAAVTEQLRLLKSARPAGLDLQRAAIVSFPSFHVVLAILSATALGSVRRLRVAAWGLAGMTCVSTMTTGWHYGIDVVGGLAVSVASLAVARTVVSPALERGGEREGEMAGVFGSGSAFPETP